MSSPFVLTLVGSHDLSTASATHARLLDASAAGSIHLDMTGVESADIGLVQLVLSLQASLAARGDALRCDASPAVADAFARCGAALPSH